MTPKSFIEWAREKLSAERMYLSHHAQMERGKDKVSVDDIIAAILNGKVLESYPDDPRGGSCLVAGQGLDNRWLHVVCGTFGQDDLLIITVYIPKLPKWLDPFTRRS
jgi:hypothetical protein